MPDRKQSPYDQAIKERRTPLSNDVDPDGMDSDTEGAADGDPVRDDADGAVDRRSTGQDRTSGTHGTADADTSRRTHRD
ncbi:MAG TPA: hypothetical protein VLV86_00050 [Vicinamibacterales bacterium]|nr:hypothetical protein [Vicinamibacterales bacterium]